MGLPNNDELEGKWDQAKGKTKETIGRAINDDDLAALSATRRATRLSRSQASKGISHPGQSSSPIPGSGRVPSKRTDCNDAGSTPSARKIVGATCVVVTRRSTCRSW